MTVGVIDRDEENDYMFEQAWTRLRYGNVAQQCEPRVFSIWFAGMYAGLDQNNRFTGFSCRFRTELFPLGYDQEWKFAPFTTSAKALKMNQGRSRVQSF